MVVILHFLGPVGRFFWRLRHAVQDLLLVLAGAGLILAVWMYFFGGVSIG